MFPLIIPGVTLVVNPMLTGISIIRIQPRISNPTANVALSETAGVFEGGLDYFLSKNDIFGLSFNFGPRTGTHGSITDYTVSYLNPADQNDIYSTYDYTSFENNLRGGHRYSIRADYTHTFAKEDENAVRSKGAGQGHGHGPGGPVVSMNGKNSTKHQIKLDVSYSNWNMDEDGYTYLVDAFGDTTEGQRTTEIGPSNSIQSNFEYTYPINMSSNFEAGANARFNWKSDGNDLYYYDPLTGNWDLQDLYSNYTAYKTKHLLGLCHVFHGIRLVRHSAGCTRRIYLSRDR